MTDANGGLSRYEARVRAFWSAEPQRGIWTPDDDEARIALAAECALDGLDYWAKTERDALSLPTDQGAFKVAAERFAMLGVTVLAFPSPAIRGAFVSRNKGAEAIADDAFWG